jgi:hypothetical protein
MADYYPLLAKALANLPSRTTPTGRRAIYERARKALIGQLRSIQPPMPDKDIADEDAALDLAIARLEAEYAAQPAPPPAPVAARPGPTAQPRSAAPGTSAPPGPTGAAPIAAAARRPLAPTGPTAIAAPSAPPQARPSAPPRRTPMSAAPAQPAALAPTIEAASIAGKASSVSMAPPVEARFAADEAEGGLAPAVAVSAPVAFKAAAENARPSAPGMGDARRRRNPWPMFAAALAIGIAGAIALAAYFWRETPQDFSAGTREATRQVVAPAVQSKIAERVTTGEEPASTAGDTMIPKKVPVAPVTPPAAAPSAAAPSAPPAATTTASGAVNNAPADSAAAQPLEAQAPSADQPHAPPQSPQAQPASQAPPAQLGQTTPAAAADTARAAMLIASASDPQKPSVNLGKAVWSLIPAVAGQPSTVAVRVDIDIPEQKMHATVTIRKNADATLPATHTIDLRTTFGDGSGIKGIKDMDLPRLRQSEAPTGDALSGVRVKINDSYFLVGLTRTDADAAARNLTLLAKNNWFDFPLLLDDDRIAKLTFEKGATGEKVMAQALSAWN